MQTDSSTIHKLLSKDLTDAAIRIALIAFLVIMCWRVFAPFANLLMWSLILAVALYPLHQRLAKSLAGRQGRAATLMVVAGLLLIGAPTLMLGASFAKQVQRGYTALETHTLSIPAPSPSVAEWPIVGKRVHGAWSAAADNLPEFLEDNKEQVKSLSRKALAVAGKHGRCGPALRGRADRRRCPDGLWRGGQPRRAENPERPDDSGQRTACADPLHGHHPFGGHRRHRRGVHPGVAAGRGFHRGGRTGGRSACRWL